MTNLSLLLTKDPILMISQYTSSSSTRCAWRGVIQRANELFKVYTIRIFFVHIPYSSLAWQTVISMTITTIIVVLYYIHNLTTVWESIFHCHKNQEIFHLVILFTILHMYFTLGQNNYWIINVLGLVNQFKQKLHYISPIYFEILALALDVNKVEDFNHWINSHPRTRGSVGWASGCHTGGSTPVGPTLRVLK